MEASDSLLQKKNKIFFVLYLTHPHVLRHTACTRMAEKGMDIKVLQYLMGHSSIDITMQVYNHITDMSRVKNEVVKMDEAVNA